MLLAEERGKLTVTIVDGRYIKPIIVKTLTATASLVLLNCNASIRSEKFFNQDYLRLKVTSTGSPSATPELHLSKILHLRKLTNPTAECVSSLAPFFFRWSQ